MSTDRAQRTPARDLALTEFVEDNADRPDYVLAGGVREHVQRGGRVPLSIRTTLGERRFVAVMNLAFPDGWR